MTKRLFGYVLLGMWCGFAIADNPLVTHIFTADPSARYYDGVLYVYPSHDIDDNGQGVNGFTMQDYHVFSSTDLMNFTDHGVALHVDQVPWAAGTHTMWAPDCIKKGSNYYFYFPTQPISGAWQQVGVAISSSPTGPFTPQPNYIPEANAIDPNIFIDDDGTPYLYFGGGPNDSLKVVEMNQDMVTAASSRITLTNLGNEYKEGPWMFKRNGTYYMTYPRDISDGFGESIVYATGSSPTGPFTYQGRILDGWNDCWTIHHSILEIEGQWYVFYHHEDISGDATLRSMCADKLYFNGDGTIQKVTPTRRGIGIRDASEQIQVDRYLNGSPGLYSPAFSQSVPSGFFLSGIDENEWVQYPDVDFGTGGATSVTVRVASSSSTASLELRVGGQTGTLLGTLPISSTGGISTWGTQTFDIGTVGQAVSGVQDLYLVFKGSGANLYRVDWVQFTIDPRPPLPPAPGKQVEILHVEAENFSTHAGVQTEPCDEGTLNVGWIDDGDYIMFSNVVFSGTVTSLNSRVASDTAGGTITVCVNDINASPACTVDVGNTGTWQTYVTEEDSFFLPEGTYDLYFKFSGGTGGLLNVNWFKFIGPSGYRVWMTTHGLTRDYLYTDDPDGDGINNQLEYALDFSPSETNAFIDKMVVDTNGISASHIDKSDMDIKLYYSQNLTNGWTQLAPSTTPPTMPEDTVYYLFDPANTNGYFYWTVEEVP